MNTRGLWLAAAQADDAGGRVSSTPRMRYVRFGPFDLDTERQELFRGGARIPMSRKVIEVLLILVENPGEVVTRETLRNRLWPPDFHVNYNANVNTTVNKLRLILGDSTDQPTFVATIPRRGYAFIAKTEFLNVPSARQDTSPLAARTELKAKATFPSWFSAKVVSFLVIGMIVGALVAYLIVRN